MANFDQFAIKAGWDATSSMTNFESIFKTPGVSIRIPLGDKIEESMNFHGHAQGRKRVSMKYGGVPHSYLDTYVTTYFSNWDTLYAEVTLYWKLRNNTWDHFNAVAHLPVDQEDYEHLNDNFVIDLELWFDIVGLSA